MQLAFLDFEAAFDSPHRGRLFNALCADGVPGNGVRQGAVAGPFLFNFAIDGMRRTVDQCPADIVLAPSRCPLTDLEHATMLLYLRKAVRNFNMLSTLYGSWLQPMDHVYALINASRCGCLRDLERESGVCHNEHLYAEIDVVYRRMTRGRYQHLAPPSKVAKVNRLRFFGHILRRPADRLVQ
ncbi:hypothetical protein RB195_023609 [Necator americanus]|uniref:Reverse transcriptase domain-containing protein n=1 Tax=Necator americanus TaxID=51031 RepID=A0ABR1EJV4_NECAM